MMDKQGQEKAAPEVQAQERTERAINMGGAYLELRVVGVDPALQKLDELRQKISEVNALIRELSQARVEVQVAAANDGCL